MGGNTHKSKLRIPSLKRVVPKIIEGFSIAFTANGRLNFPFYQKLVKIIWFQLIFCLLATAMEQVLKTEK